MLAVGICVLPPSVWITIRFCRSSIWLLIILVRGKTKVALEVFDNRSVVGPQIEFETQAEFDKTFEIDLQPAFENQTDFGILLGSRCQVEQRQ